MTTYLESQQKSNFPLKNSFLMVIELFTDKYQPAKSSHFNTTSRVVMLLVSNGIQSVIFKQEKTQYHH